MHVQGLQATYFCMFLIVSSVLACVPSFLLGYDFSHEQQPFCYKQSEWQPGDVEGKGKKETLLSFSSTTFWFTQLHFSLPQHFAYSQTANHFACGKMAATDS